MIIFIYIPIWLDLLFRRLFFLPFVIHYLHSNMVRFIIKDKQQEIIDSLNLHSNMVRFIIRQKGTSPSIPLTFTFQYG